MRNTINKTLLSSFLIFFSTTLEGSSIRVINRVNNSTDEIKTLDDLRGVFVSVKEVSRVLSSRKPYINNDRNKMVMTMQQLVFLFVDIMMLEQRNGQQKVVLPLK